MLRITHYSSTYVLSKYQQENGVIVSEAMYWVYVRESDTGQPMIQADKSWVDNLIGGHASYQSNYYCRLSAGNRQSCHSTYIIAALCEAEF